MFRSIATCLAPALLALSGTVLADTTAVTMATGRLQDADQRHQAGGRVIIEMRGEIYQLLLTDFTVTPGPDLEVWLVRDPAPSTSAAVLASEWISLGPLESPTGNQSYPLPQGSNPGDWGSVVIWCEDFSVLFGTATLER